MNEKNVPDEIIVKLPTQYAMVLLEYLLSHYTHSHLPFGKLTDFVFEAVDEQLYKIIAPEQHKRIQEILEKYGDEE